MNVINYLVVKMLVKVKFANIVNIAAKEEIIPELIQSNCNSKNIYNKIDSFFSDNQSIKTQIEKTQKILNDFRTNKSSEIAASVLANSL